MTYIRDDATARTPAAGPPYQILGIQDEYSARWAAAQGPRTPCLHTALFPRRAYDCTLAFRVGTRAFT
jgi:hypothetical protein